MRRLSEPTVFLKLDVSCVLADSPIMRERGPNATSDLRDEGESALAQGCAARVAARVGEWDARSRAVRDLVDEDVDATVAGGTDLGEEERGEWVSRVVHDELVAPRKCSRGIPACTAPARSGETRSEAGLRSLQLARERTLLPYWPMSA